MGTSNLIEPHLLQSLMNFSGINDVDARLKKLEEDEKKDVFIVPVLGVQGAGKSSFINALLFNDIVLPVEVSETTCIPTEISFADIPEPRATVYFTDKPDGEEIPCTEAELRKYVHQEFNPSNILHVDRVEIRLKNDMLKNGLVIVDLPGVGSGTMENQQRTMNYLSRSSGGIFLASETLKRPDAMFFCSAMQQLGRVFFVENHWSGESATDVKDATDENRRILREMIQQLQLPEDLLPEIHVISVKKALDAAITDNAEAMKSSGMEGFQQILSGFASEWSKQQREIHLAMISGWIQKALRCIASKIEVMKNDPLPEKQKLDERKKNAENEIAEKQNLVNEIKGFLESNNSALQLLVVQRLPLSAKKLRTEVRNLIDRGITSGEHLNRAFGQLVEKENDALFMEISEEISRITAGLRERLTGLETGEEFQRINPLKGQAFSNKTQSHALYEPVLSSGAAIGAGVGAGALGAKIGAAIGSGGGPAGAIIGGVIGGLLGWAIGSFAGRKTKELHVSIQQSEAKQELFDAISRYCDESQKKVQAAVENYMAFLSSATEGWFEARKTAIRDEISGLENDLKRSESDKAAQIRNLESEKAYLEQKLKQTIDAR